MANTVSMGADGVVRHAYIGDQTPEEVEINIQKVEELTEALRADNKPVRILVDLREIGKTDDTIRRVAIDSVKKNKYDMVAVVGRNLFYKYLTGLVAMQFSKYSDLRYFTSLEEAENWLKGNAKHN